MNYLRNQIRTLFDDTFVTKGQEYTMSEDRVCIFSCLIKTRNIWHLQLFIMANMLVGHLLFTSMINEWIVVNAWSGALLGILYTTLFASLFLCHIAQKHIGIWVYNVQGEERIGKNRKRKLRFIVA